MATHFLSTVFPACLGVLTSILMAVSTAAPAAAAQSDTGRLIAVGEPFPETAMPVPESRQDRNYLGLPDGRTFTVSQIKADLVLVEIMNVFCFSCQKQAPVYNELYEMIEKDPRTQGRIKLMGVAAGNNLSSVEKFRTDLKVPFPIIADPQFLMHQAIGGSRTPFSIFVRQTTGKGPGLVGRTHLGINYRYDRIFEDMQALMTLDVAAIREKQWRGELEGASQAVRVKPLFSDEELDRRVARAFSREGTREVTEFARLGIPGFPGVYTALVAEGGKDRRMFAQAVARASVCDVCHDNHFIFVFDSDGKVTDFVPLQLTKYGNVPWDQADIAAMRKTVLGRYISRPWGTDPEADAVSSATITSAVIFDSLARGEALFRALRGRNLL